MRTVNLATTHLNSLYSEIRVCWSTAAQFLNQLLSKNGLDTPAILIVARKHFRHRTEPHKAFLNVITIHSASPSPTPKAKQ